MLVTQWWVTNYLLLTLSEISTEIKSVEKLIEQGTDQVQCCQTHLVNPAMNRRAMFHLQWLKMQKEKTDPPPHMV